MNNTTKVLKTVAAILVFVAVATAIVGSALMFTEVRHVYRYDSEVDDFGIVTQKTTSWYKAYPEVGILPAVGAVLAIATAVFFLLAKKKRQATIVSMVSALPALAALSVSGVLLEWNSPELSRIGWYLCLGGAGLLLAAFVLSIIILVKDYKGSSESSEICRMSLAQKVLWILSLVVTIIAVGLAAVGSFIMFGDNFMSGGASIACREAGIMPLFGAVLLLIAAVLLILSRKERKTVIGNWVALFVSQVLLSVSFVMIHGFEGWLGYWFCVSAASVASAGFVLSLIYGIMSLRALRKSGAETLVDGKNGGVRYYKKDAFAEIFMQAAMLLKEAKGLLDIGAFTEEEFKTGKELILDHYGLFKTEKSADAPAEEKAEPRE